MRLRLPPLLLAPLAVAGGLGCFAPAEADAADLKVDARAPAGGDGSAAAPFRSIQDAVLAAAPGDRLQIAGTQYLESVEIDTHDLTLEGGYPGATADVYASGGEGDFSTSSPAAFPTIVEGDGDLGTIAFFDAGDATLRGLTITGGFVHGVYAVGYPWDAHSLLVEGCVIEGNGNPGDEGGGLYAEAVVTVRGSVLRDNVGDRGAAIAMGGQLLVEGSLVEDNVGHGDHGGGIYAYGDVTLLSNVVRGNRTGESAGYGWGGGVLVFGRGSVALFRGNLVTANFAPTYGSGEFIDDGAFARIENELIVDNACPNGSGAGLYVDGENDDSGSGAELVNVTIAGHAGCPGAGNAVLVERASLVTIESSILWGNGPSFELDGTSAVAVSYSDVEDGAPGEGNLQVDPEFGDPGAGDYHLRHASGRPDVLGACVVDATTSPLVDAGHPEGAYQNEPSPNGGRVDMGAYGNTPFASCDPSAATVATTGVTSGATTGAGPGATTGVGGSGAGAGGRGAGGASGDGDGDGAGDASGDGDGDGDAATAADEGGCALEAGGGRGRSTAWVSALLALAGLAARRRRSP